VLRELTKDILSEMHKKKRENEIMMYKSDKNIFM
jgi:hypothetical protein